MGTWEQIYNSDFKVVEFDHFKAKAGLHTFVMDDVEYKKCKNMAFFHSLTEENYDAINKLIRSELGE